MNSIAVLCLGALLPEMISAFGLPAVTEGCPPIYRRFSDDHTFCKPPNPKCQLVRKGLDRKYIPEILHAHNMFRSFIASGRERRAGGMPPAADMLQLSWDEELASIVRQYIEQCNFAHDDWRQRAIRAFGVGQNLAFYSYACEDANCYREPQWTHVVTGFYDEVRYFNRTLVKAVPYLFEYGHFVGLVFAEAYKIGCDYVVYMKGGWARELYACNYGPTASMLGERMYTEGPPCSKCPRNSCCGSTCRENHYPALCQLTSLPPDYVPHPGYVLECSFQRGNPACEVEAVEGPDRWKYLSTAGGVFLEVIARPDSVHKAHFKSTIEVQGWSCFLLTYRTGPQVYGEGGERYVEVQFELNGRLLRPMPIPINTKYTFDEMTLSFYLIGHIKFIIIFTVPPSVPIQFIEMKRIEITATHCDPILQARHEILYTPPKKGVDCSCETNVEISEYTCKNNRENPLICNCESNPTLTEFFCAHKES